MKGHIRRRGKRSWAVVIDLGDDPATGIRHQKWYSVKGTRKEAERRRTELLHGMQTGTYVDASSINVGAFLEQWLEDYANPNVGPRTFERYRSIVRNHLEPGLGRLRLSDLRPHHINSVYGKWRRSGRLDGRGGLSPRTILQHHRILREAVQHAVQWQLLASNPADGVQTPRFGRREFTALDRDQVQRLFEAADLSWVGTIVRFAVYMGLRQGEILGLRWADVDLPGKAVHVRQTVQYLSGKGYVFPTPKTRSSRRMVTMTDSAVTLLRSARADQAGERLRLGAKYRDHDLVFCVRDGGPISASNLIRDFRRVVRRTDVAVVQFDDHRHTPATLLLQQGVHLKIVSEQLGHASVTITLDMYSLLLPELQEAAAESLDNWISEGASEDLNQTITGADGPTTVHPAVLPAPSPPRTWSQWPLNHRFERTV